MITLSLLKFLEDNNLGTIDVDLFWQKLSLGKVGIYITDIGSAQARGARRSQRYEIYARGTSDPDGLARLNRVIEFLNNSYDTCSLPPVPPVTTDSYKNVTIMPLSTPTSVGEDANGRIIWSASGELIY